ncbi:MAG: hypothetical protein EOP56_18210 [Sphingobacteriales bacterium]|nr:MAG: hypothetical protein EOP56_18210 [Sphingobacteriales bacterium]
MEQKSQEPDYYFLPDGRLVFTASYHLKRGHCCGNGCRHCPYDFVNVREPRRSQLLKERAQNGKAE